MRLPPPGDAASRLWILCALVYALALTLSITSQSLWTDEGFSAWLAAHRTFSALLQSLRTGDSSDLQMSLYYSWLFFWSGLFGHSEYALRAANIPFILIFSLALVWTSFRIFRSRFAWLTPALLPFVWTYAAEGRPYMALLGFSATALAAALGYKSTGARKFVWLFLASLLVGAMFHMLMLLVAVPALAILLPLRNWRDWRTPMAVFAIPFLALGAFLLWTLLRPQIEYDYVAPGLKQMVSVFYEFAGFGGLGPNRKLSLDFRSHALPLALGGGAIITGLAFALYAFLKSRRRSYVTCLACAVLVGCAETLVLAVLTGKQPDVRHLAALVPVFLFLVTGVLARPARVTYAAALLLAVGWLTADIRSAVLPEYRKEDYRGAVASVRALHDRTEATVILATDAVTPAYYGLDLVDEPNCYPFVTSCSAAMEKVAWPRLVPAINGHAWSQDTARQWLAAIRNPVIVLHSLDRSARNLRWRPLLDAYPNAPRMYVHGFELVLLQPPDNIQNAVHHHLIPDDRVDHQVVQ